MGPMVKQPACSAAPTELKCVTSFTWQQPPQPYPQQEKVTAHDAAAWRLRHPKAVGNDMADASARWTASEPSHTLWLAEGGPFGDPVEMFSASGARVTEVHHRLAEL